MIDVLMDYGVEFVEQPLAPHDLDGLRFVRERSPLPIIADESCLVATDIPRAGRGGRRRSTSSSPSAVGCARRSKSSRRRARTACS